MTPELSHSLNKIAGVMGLGLCIGGALFIMWIFALINAIASEFENQSNKTAWILVLLLVPPIGAVLYPFISGGQKRSRTDDVVMKKVIKQLPERDDAVEKDGWF